MESNGEDLSTFDTGCLHDHSQTQVHGFSFQRTLPTALGTVCSQHTDGLSKLVHVDNLAWSSNCLCCCDCLYYVHWPFNVIQGDHYYRLILHTNEYNSFGTPPTDRLTLGNHVTQVTTDTGSTVVQELPVSDLVVGFGDFIEIEHKGQAVPITTFMSSCNNALLVNPLNTY